MLGVLPTGRVERDVLLVAGFEGDAPGLAFALRFAFPLLLQGIVTFASRQTHPIRLAASIRKALHYGGRCKPAWITTCSYLFESELAARLRVQIMAHGSEA